MSKRCHLLHNERGAALLLALLVTGFVMIFATFLLGLTDNAHQQARTMSDRADARLLAEAGIDVYQSQLGRATSGMDDVLDVVLPDGFTHTFDDDHVFTIESVTSSLNGEVLTVRYTSIGETNGQRIKIEHETSITP